jgi:hypothetical protein
MKRKDYFIERLRERERERERENRREIFSKCFPLYNGLAFLL